MRELLPVKTAWHGVILVAPTEKAYSAKYVAPLVNFKAV